MLKELKIGLALGSGGVKGLAHIGVIKVLKANNISIDCIAGSSIGALVGAFYAAYEDVEKLEKVAFTSNWRTGLSLLDLTWRGGLIKGKKIEKLIGNWLEDINFDALKIPLTVITTDLVTGREIDINYGSVVKTVRASLSVPPLFQPVKQNGYLLVDGGLSNPLPDNIVRKMGVDLVIAVNLESGRFDNRLDGKNLSLSKISIRSLNIMRCHLAKYCLKNADIVIEPSVSEIGLVGWNRFFDNKEVGSIIKAGEEATIEALPKIKNILSV